MGSCNESKKCSPKPFTALERVNETLASALTLASRIETFRDYMLGAQPIFDADSAGEVQAGVLPNLSAHAEHVHCRISDAMAAIDDLERATT